MNLNPENEEQPISIWKVMSPGTHARIVQVLEADQDVNQALTAFNNNPNPTTRDKAIDTIVRYTGNCIGQAAFQEAQGTNAPDLKLIPNDATRSIYRVLTGGENPIFVAIDADAQARTALHQGHADATVSLISRMTGRCVGQTLFGLGISLASAISHL